MPTPDAKLRILARFKTAVDNLAESAKVEIAAQGHRASGKMMDSIESKVINSNFNSLAAAVLVEDYGQFVDSGTKPHLPPISALIEWARYVRPSLSDKEKRSFAFAVRAKIGKEGTPTSGSFAYSKNGRRKDFVLFGIEKKEPSDWAAELDLESEFSKIIEQ